MALFIQSHFFAEGRILAHSLDQSCELNAWPFLVLCHLGEPGKAKAAHLAFGGIKSRMWLFQNRDKGYRKGTPLPGSFQKLANRLPARLCEA